MEVGHLTEKAQRDYILIQNALNKGDQHAYAALMKNYRDTLYFMMLKMTNNAHDAEDLTIEAFGKAFKRLKHYTPEYAFSTWLFKIASNNAIDFIRKKKRITFVSDNYDEDQDIASRLPSAELDPEEIAIQDQKIKAMREVVHKLKPHYRKLIEMRYFQELSYNEIVEEMDLPLGTIKAQLFRARDLLYQILKNSRENI